MAVFRVERTKDYTVMSNIHLRDKNISLKAKGLLSQMLSLPEDWDYTLGGLAHINRESKDAIRSAVNELEKAGYIHRRQTTDARGKFGSNEYIIHEKPVTPPEKPSSGNPSPEKPSSGNPTTEIPSPDITSSENPTQLNIDIPSIDPSITDVPNTDSFFPGQPTPPPYPPANSSAGQEGKRNDGTTQLKIDYYREYLRQNISYPRLVTEYPNDVDQLDEIVELMLEVVSTKRKTTRIAGADFAHEVVRSRFLKLNGDHIRFVMDCMRENTTRIRNIKQYLLTTLYNAPSTMNSYYSARVNHDLYGGP